MLRILAFLYLAYFLIWFLAEWRDLRRSGYPNWMLILEAFTNGFLLLGMIFYLTSYSPGMVQKWWCYPLHVAVVAEVFMRTMSYRHEEQDLDLPASLNRSLYIFALVFVLVSLIPALLMNYRIAMPAESLMSCLFLLVPAAMGGLVGSLVPRINQTFHSSNEREMVQWLQSSSEFSSAPDKIEWIDSQERDWPGEEEPKFCHLFQITYQEKTYVGLNGPITHCFPQEVTGKIEVDQIYTDYENEYLDSLSKDIIRNAANGFPSDFRKLVEEALDPPSDDIQ